MPNERIPYRDPESRNIPKTAASLLRANLNYLLLATIFSTPGCLGPIELRGTNFYNEFDEKRHECLREKEGGKIFPIRKETQYGALNFIRITRNDKTGGASYPLMNNQLQGLNEHSQRESNTTYQIVQIHNVPAEGLFVNESLDSFGREIFFTRLHDTVMEYYDDKAINIVWINNIPELPDGFDPAGYFTSNRFIGEEYIVMSFEGPSVDDEGNVIYTDDVGPRTIGRNTLAHEVGHFFGLHHTFETRPKSYCKYGGSCHPDIKFDPGTYNEETRPDGCKVDRNTCQIIECPGDIEHPDTDKLMSYYHCGDETSDSENALTICMREKVYENIFFQSEPYTNAITLDPAQFKVGCEESDCYSSIQQAIDVALDASFISEIIIHEDTYYENIVIPKENYRLTIKAKEGEEVTIDGLQDGPTFQIHKPQENYEGISLFTTIAIENLTLTNGYPDCLAVYDAEPDISHVTFQGCPHGAIYAEQSLLKLNNSHIRNNRGINYSGAYLNNSEIHMQGGSILNNQNSGAFAGVINIHSEIIDLDQARAQGIPVFPIEQVTAFRNVSWDNPNTTDIRITNGESYEQITTDIDCGAASGTCDEVPPGFPISYSRTITE